MKKIIRQEVLAKLTELSHDPEVKKAKEAELLTKLFSSSLWKKSETVAVTISLGVEVATEEILARGRAEGKLMVVPKITQEKAMVFIKTNLRTVYEESAFGVLEPKKGVIISKNDLDLIIVPGVGFRPDGYRIGFGGGFYDRYLADYQGKTCSLVFREQLVSNWEPQPYDIAVQQLIIENNQETRRNE